MAIASDVEIAQAAKLKPIAEVAEELGLGSDEIEPYGAHKAKVGLDALARRENDPDGKLILVTAMTPTPLGEGKTLTTVGLGQALARLGKKSVICVREPSLGPVFGIKGGAAGGGMSQVLPMEDINLHFTGDIHAVTSAHNLLSTLLDAHIFHGNELGFDVNRVTWKRVLDMNDRALRHVLVGLGGRTHGVPREEGFMITAASEIMAVLCLASDPGDMKERIARVVVGYTRKGAPITAGDLNAAGAMALLLKDAIKPNLVQTLEGSPAFVHGGPFGNIAHGTNSLIADKLALKLGDVMVVEAGFGSDLGAEKFFDITARTGGLSVDAVVLVATVRALKLHGGVPFDKDALAEENVDALTAGFANLKVHIENIQGFGAPVVVAVNRFASDTDAEIARVKELCTGVGAPCHAHELHAKGGEGGTELAETAYGLACANDAPYTPLYPLDMPLAEKIEAIATRIYRAGAVRFEPGAARSLRSLTQAGLRRASGMHREDAGLPLGRPQEAGRAGGLHSERARGVRIRRGRVRRRHSGEHHADARPRQDPRLRGNGRHG